AGLREAPATVRRRMGSSETSAAHQCARDQHSITKENLAGARRLYGNTLKPSLFQSNQIDRGHYHHRENEEHGDVFVPSGLSVVKSRRWQSFLISDSRCRATTPR